VLAGKQKKKDSFYSSPSIMFDYHTSIWVFHH